MFFCVALIAKLGMAIHVKKVRKGEREPGNEARERLSIRLSLCICV